MVSISAMLITWKPIVLNPISAYGNSALNAAGHRSSWRGTQAYILSASVSLKQVLAFWSGALSSESRKHWTQAPTISTLDKYNFLKRLTV